MSTRWTDRLVVVSVMSAVVCLLWASNAQAESEAGHVTHHHSHHAAVFVGATVITEEVYFTAGAEYEFRLPLLNRLLGVAAFGEAIFADETAVVVGGGIVAHPFADLKLGVMPAVEVADGHKVFLFRVGAGYDFHLGRLSVTPVVNVDFVDGHVAVVFGVAVGGGF